MNVPRSLLLTLFLLAFFAPTVPAFALDCLANGCHQTLTGQKNLHQPVADGECLACHEQKASAHPASSGKSFALSDSVANLCNQCHELDKATEKHRPVAAGECLACHNPHGSAQPKLLKAPMPLLCLECHAAVQSEIDSKIKHAAIYRDKSCGGCHSGHSSRSPALLVAPEQELCLSCHGQDDFSRSNPLRNIRREIEGKPHLHGPVAKGQCSPCHASHGSPYFRLLREDYPSGPYAYTTKTYLLCFTCHNQAMLDSPKASDVTKFRNERQNLHFVHAIDHRKGRVCTICHASHGSANSGLIKEKGSEFGDWIIPINFKPTSTGGSCAPGCHKAAQYDRSKAQIKITSKKEPN